MIFECVVTTLNPDGSVHISPMGPEVNKDWSEFELRPFAPSTTLENLERTGAGVLHVFDRVLIFAESITGKPITDNQTRNAEAVDGKILASACRAIEFKAVHIDRSENRASIQCRSTKIHEMHPYSGMNRARNAVIEAAVLASRIMFIPIETIQEQFDAVKGIVERTGDKEEIEAFAMLEAFVRDHKAETDHG